MDKKITMDFTKYSAVVLGALLASGCASTKMEKTMTEMRDNTTNAQRTADQAKGTADNAMSAATRAQGTADSAKSSADQASQQARDAMDASQKNSAAIDELNDKIDRMFKKAMHK